MLSKCNTRGRPTLGKGGVHCATISRGYRGCRLQNIASAFSGGSCFPSFLRRKRKGKRVNRESIKGTASHSFWARRRRSSRSPTRPQKKRGGRKGFSGSWGSRPGIDRVIDEGSSLPLRQEGGKGQHGHLPRLRPLRG